jgi:predicted nucleic acid-binding protein
MKTVFGDTFYWIALLNRNDEHHQRATTFRLEPNIKVALTAWIVTETADALSSPRHRGPVPEFFRSLLADAYVEYIPPSQELLNRGLELFAARPDKVWSLTDCISFVVMQDLGLTEALTGDHHFEQAGFVALLK